MSDEIPVPTSDSDHLQSLRTITMVVYGLQAAAFLFGITALVAIIVNNVKKDDVLGTWLESHFRWQIRTFWYGLLWAGLFCAVCRWGLGHLPRRQRLAEPDGRQGDVCRWPKLPKAIAAIVTRRGRPCPSL